MAAVRMEFDDLFSALYPIGQFRTGLLDGSLPLLTFFSKRILPLLDAKEDRFAIARIVRQDSPLTSAEALLKSADNEAQQLEKAQDAVNSLLKLLTEGKSPTFRDVAENIAKSGLFVLPEALRIAVDRIDALEIQVLSDDDEPENERTDRDKAVDAFLGAPFAQIRPYAQYVEGKARFDTHQGVKGLEFPRVMVVMDDSEARGFLFKYEKIFGGSAAEDGITAATRRLFYVTSSRAERSLALVAYTDDPERVKNHVISQGWFEMEEVHMDVAGTQVANYVNKE